MTSVCAVWPGDLGTVEYVYTSVRGELSLQLVTDGTGSFNGFTGSFTKVYSKTDIRGEGVNVWVCESLCGRVCG